MQSCIFELLAEGRWPWPRSKIAALIDILSRDGARVIAFDIAFTEPDENSQLALIDQFAQKIDALAIKEPQLADLITESKRHADNDLALANAIKNSSAAVVLGYFFHMREADLNYRIEQRDIDQQLRRISASKYPFIVYQDQQAGGVPFISAYAPESNLDVFTESAASAGYFTTTSDPDGVVRWMPLMVQAGEDLFPPLAVATAWHYLGRPQPTVKVGRYGRVYISFRALYPARDDRAFERVLCTHNRMPPGWRLTANSAGAKRWRCQTIPDSMVGGRSLSDHGGTLPNLPEGTAAGRVGGSV